MPRRNWYRPLAFFALGASLLMGVLAVVALGLSSGFEAAAAGACALLFFVPGFVFLNQARRIRARDLALARVGRVARERGVTDAEAMGRALDLPAEDAGKILKKAIAEGHADGEMDARGRFVAADAPRCPACHAPVPRAPAPQRCPACGASMPSGG